MKIPVILNLEKHDLAIPVPDATFLDSTVAALRYHKLDPLEPGWSCDGSPVCICVYDKV